LPVFFRFGFFGFRLIKPKLNRTGRFFQNFNRFFFTVRFFWFFFSGFLGFLVFLLTPSLAYTTSFRYYTLSISGSFGWSSRHFQVGECGVSDHFQGCNHHLSTEKHPFLQHHFYEIKHLHPIFSNDLSKILSTISHPYVFRFYVDRVDTFKWMNVELQTSRLSKIRSNIKICTPSTMIMWSEAMLTSVLLWQSHESGQPSQL